MTETKIKSCLNCIHVKTWNYPGHPPDNGWECGKEDVSYEGWVEPEEYLDYDEFAIYCAACCADYEYNPPLTPEQQKAMEDISEIPNVYAKHSDLYLESNDEE